MPKRRIVIGDIHNSYLALKQLIERLKLTKEDLIIFIGDYVDGWLQAVETINYLLELQKEYNCIFVEGNHDKWFTDYLQGRIHPGWLMNGGKTTLDSVIQGRLEDKVDEEAYLKFFTSLKSHHITNDNIAFVHGGYMHKDGLRSVARYDQTWDRTLWENVACAGHPEFINSRFLPHKLRIYEHVYIGHTATTRMRYGDRPITKCNVTNVDQGAGWNGKLSALDVDSKYVWQSDLVKDLYPNEKGR